MTQSDLNKLSQEEIWYMIEDLDLLDEFITHPGWKQWSVENPGKAISESKLIVAMWPQDVFFRNSDSPHSCVYVNSEHKKVERSLYKIISKRRKIKIENILK